MSHHFIHRVLILTLGLAIAGAALAQSARTSTGVVVADRSVTLATKIIGRIAAVNVDEGDLITAGQVLVDIEDTQARAELASAQAVLKQEQVKREHTRKLDERYRSLYEQDSISLDRADEATFNHDIAKASVQRAEAEVARMKALLAETKIVAPFDGVVISRLAEVGKVTAMGEPLLAIEDQRRLLFRTRINEQDIALIEKGQSLPVTIDALNDLELSAVVEKIIPSGDISTHEFTVEATLPVNDRLLPGMFGKAEIRPAR